MFLLFLHSIFFLYINNALHVLCFEAAVCFLLFHLALMYLVYLTWAVINNEVFRIQFYILVFIYATDIPREGLQQLVYV